MPNHTEAKAQQPKPQTQILIGLGTFALGAPMALFGLYFLFLGDQSRAWPTANGVVESSTVKVDSDINRRSSSSRRATRSKRRHLVEIQYRYEVDGQIHRSSRYSFGSGDTAARARTREKAEGLARERFPVGAEVQVFYDPDQHNQSVLAAGLNWGTFVPLVLGLLFALGGAAIVGLGMKRRAEVNVSAS